MCAREIRDSIPNMAMVDDIKRYLGLEGRSAAVSTATPTPTASKKTAKDKEAKASPIKKNQQSAPPTVSSASNQHPVITVTEPSSTPTATAKVRE